MDSQGDPQQRDLHIGVLIIGCATALGLFCLEMVLGAVPFIGLSGPLRWIYQVFALVILGYVTGRTAMSEKALPNLHVVVLGFFLMQAQMLAFLLNYIMSPDEAMGIFHASTLTFFIIPLMLLGCGVARMKNRARQQAGLSQALR